MDTCVCQSCGMNMQPEVYGKNADGSPNSEYCKYCWVDGHFSKDETMEEMIESNLQFLDEFNKGGGTNLTPDEARAEMMKYFPNLKRWQAE
ncbi:MAG: zinc ribbon domain-containing protein [Oscillospiraceae bacterium]|nr:zinc ribbon domain-containing protein [Oscillospiraceae bacterium]